MELNLKELINFFISGILKADSNIAIARKRIATFETSKYVEENMPSVSSVDSMFKVHEKAISKICNASNKELILEFGVFKGKTINFLAKKFPKNTLFGFDSFEGLPEFWRDGFQKGAFKLNELPNVENNITLIKGFFDKTIPKFLEKEKANVQYMHIDCDLYSSTKIIFKSLHKRIKKGTVIVFDEYFNYPGWQSGEFKAFQEFIEYSKLSFEYITYNRNGEQVAVQII